MDDKIIKSVMGQVKGDIYEIYIDYLLGTLTSARPPEYFVDWKKVKDNTKRYVTEIALLESIFRLPKEERAIHFREIWKKWKDKKKLAEALVMLIAYRVDKQGFPSLRLKDNIVKISFCDVDSLVTFAEEVGIFSQLDIGGSLLDYLLGVEVGLDTNARKNRSGKIFELYVCKPLLKRLFLGKKIVYQDKKTNLWKNIGNSKRKYHDFVIYHDEDKTLPYMVVECTFIATSGSKPTAIAESYPKLSELAGKSDMRFLWLIDGEGWKQQRGDLIAAVKEVDIVSSPVVLDKIIASGYV